MSKQTHALTLVAAPEFQVAKAQLKKLQAAALAQLQAITDLEGKAAIGAVISGLTLHRVKASMKHGEWGAWVQANSHTVRISHRQINYYMRLALVFLERAKVQKPTLLALPGDQLALEVGDNDAAKEFFTKAEKFVGGLSLTELLIKHGIKGVGLKSELTSGDDESDSDLTPEQQAEQDRTNAWLDVWNPMQELRLTLTDPNKVQLLTDAQKVESLKAELVEATKLVTDRLATLRATQV